METEKPNQEGSNPELEELVSIIQSKGISYLDMLTYLRKQGYMESEVRQAMKNLAEKKQSGKSVSKPDENATGAESPGEISQNETTLTDTQRKILVEFDDKYTEQEKQLAKSNGQQNMILGLVICVIGILVTVLSYQAAANNPRGGRYMIAYGAIIWGGITFIKGLVQASSSDNTSQNN